MHAVFDRYIPGIVAGENLRVGDWCRIREDGKAWKLTDGDRLQASDVVAVSDCKAGDIAEIRSVRTRIEWTSHEAVTETADE